MLKKLKYKILNRLKRELDNHSLIDPATIIGENFIHSNSKISAGVIIGNNVKVIKGVQISGNVQIGNNTSINGPGTDILSMIHPVKIGKFCSIARNVAIQEYNHKFKRLSSYYIFANVFKNNVSEDIYSDGPIEIGSDVWIGTQSVILSGSQIGNGAVIAANSVIKGRIAPYAIVAGSPAKPIKFRFSEEVIQKLETIKWWNWSLNKIKKNKHLFESEVTLKNLERINE